MSAIIKLKSYLESILKHSVEERHVVQMINIANIMKNLGRHVNVIELYKSVSSFNNDKELEEWFSNNVLGDSINKEIQEATKFDPIKTSLTPNNITIEEAKRIISGKLPVEKTTDYEIAVREVEKQIIRQLKNTYIRNRGSYLHNGELDRALSIDELHKIEMQATKLMDSNPDIRQLERNNTNNKATAILLNDKSVDFRYKIETLKEIICNNYRITPESFDVWFDIIYNENLENFSINGDIKGILDKDNRRNLISKYKDFLIKSDVPHDKPVYVSEFIKEIDKIEEEKIAKSKETHGSEIFDYMIDLFDKRAMRTMGIIPDNNVKPGTNTVNKNEITKVIQRIRARR